MEKAFTGYEVCDIAELRRPGENKKPSSCQIPLNHLPNVSQIWK